MIYGPWEPRPWWIFWRRQEFRRRMWAPWHIGGGYEGREYAYATEILAGLRPPSR